MTVLKIGVALSFDGSKHPKEEALLAVQSVFNEILRDRPDASEVHVVSGRFIEGTVVIRGWKLVAVGQAADRWRGCDAFVCIGAGKEAAAEAELFQRTNPTGRVYKQGFPLFGIPAP